MPIAAGQPILRPTYRLERGPIHADEVSETWLVSGEFGDLYLVKLWQYRGDEPDTLQRALWDSELRTLYRVGSSPGAEDSILVIKDAGLDKANKCFVMVLEGHPPSTSGFETLDSLFGTRQTFAWLSNRDQEARRELWVGLGRIASGLRLLHDQSILHRNLSAAHVFLDRQVGPRSFRLGGFEWSLRVGVPGARKPPTGWSSPPEFFSEKSFGYRVDTDWFAFGMLAIRCLLNVEPLAGDDPVVRHAKVVKELARTTRISDLERTFLLRLVAVDPAERLSRPDEIRTAVYDIIVALQRADPSEDERSLVLVINPANSELLERAERAGFRVNPKTPSESFNPNDVQHVSNLAHFIQEDLAESQLYAVADAEYTILVGAKLQLLVLPHSDSPFDEKSWDLAFCRGVGELRWNEGGPAKVDLPPRSIVVRTVRQARNDKSVRNMARSWERYLPSVDRTSKLRASLGRFHEFIRCTNQLELLIRDAEIFAFETLHFSDDEHGQRLRIRQVERKRPVADFCKFDRGLSDFLMREIESNKPYCRLVVLTGPDHDGLGMGEIGFEDAWQVVDIQANAGEIELARPSGASVQVPTQGGHIRTWGMFGQVALIKRRKKAIDRLESHSYLLRSLSAPGQVFMDTGSQPLPVVQARSVVDESKQAAMEDILRVRPIYALQGPPGTGKTTLVSYLVRQILEDDPVAQILITAQAHGAVDVLRAKVRNEAFAGIPEGEQPLAVRLGTDKPFEEGSAEEVSRRILRASKEKLSALSERSDVQEQWLAAVEEMLTALATFTPDRAAPDFCEIVKRGANLTYCTTSAGSLEALADGSQSFDWSILEEAGKAHGFDLALPLQAGHRWLLIGDHKQLPPYRFEDYRKGIDDLDRAVEALVALPDRAAGLLDSDWVRSWWDRPAAERSEFKEYLRTWLNTFERVFAFCKTASGAEKLTGDSANGSAAGMLTRQYRMHPTIGDLISKVYYLDRLRNETVDRDGVPTPNVVHGLSKPEVLSQKAIVWLNTPWARRHPASAERGPDMGFARYTNLSEVHALRWFIGQLRFAKRPDKDLELAVLAPYAQQVSLLNSQLASTLQMTEGLAMKVDSRGREDDESPRRRLAYTVDSFQGNQADIIAVSLVRNNSQPQLKGLGFLDEAPRMNVLLSRAERLLVLVGSWDFFSYQVSPVFLDDPKDSLWHWKKTMTLLEEWQAEGRVLRLDVPQV